MSRSLRILMTADAMGGVWTYAMELAGAFQGRGVEILLATMGALPSPAQRQEAARFGHVDLRTSECKLEWMDDPWAEVEEAGGWLLGLAEEWQPDVIHLNGYAHADLPWGRPVLVGAHSCVLSWWRAVKGEEAPARLATYRDRVKAGLEAAHLVVAPTEAMLSALEECYSFTTPTRVIPNGRQAGLFPVGIKQPVIIDSGPSLG